VKKHELLKIIHIALLSLFCLVAQNAFAEDLLLKTPADHEGPFYPVTKQQDIDNDLIHVKGQTGAAKGDVLNLSGVVINTRGETEGNVIIEIWQTDPRGRYKHPGDSTPGERDPNFQYWGAAITDADGTFFFKTIVPGAYEPRPAHIHYKVLRDGEVILTSQIYFMKPSDRTGLPSMTSQIELQTVDIQPTKNGEFEAFFRIVI
jgi:protocatechuate 3,4-dioxygenase beta subunit